MVVDIETRDAVLDAYREAMSAGKTGHICCRSAVAAWRAIHPDHDRIEAERRALEVVHRSFGLKHDIDRE
jgi:hypothetical protein